MATCGFDSLPTELLEHIIDLLDRPGLYGFRTTCKRFEKFTFPWFIAEFQTTHRTTLMGTSLSRLEGISRDPKLRDYVKHIHIEDDCSYVDPWCASPAPRDPPELWRRTETGHFETNELGIATLRSMLSELRIRPESITIRDHRVAASNAQFCTEEIQQALPVVVCSGENSTEPVTFLAGDILQNLDMAIVSTFENDMTVEIEKTATIEHAAQPRVYNICIEFSPEHQGTGTGLALTKSVRTSTSPGSWIWALGCNAPNLETFSSHWGNQQPPIPPILASPHLTTLNFHSMTRTTTSILSLIQHSLSTLQDIHLGNVYMRHPSTWRELLSLLATSCPSLRKFCLMWPCEKNDEGNLVGLDFPRLTKQDFSEEARAGVKLWRVHNMQCIKFVEYEGDCAAEVLSVLAEWVGVRNEWSEQRRVCVHAAG